MNYRSILTLGELDPGSTNLALKQPALLAGMPERDSDGRHRHFNLEQAVRLSVFSHTLRLTNDLARSARALDQCEAWLDHTHLTLNDLAQGHDTPGCRLWLMGDAAYVGAAGDDGVGRGGFWRSLGSGAVLAQPPRWSPLRSELDIAGLSAVLSQSAT